MASHALTQGTLYILTDRDFRSEQKGCYVKIGIVTGNRQTEARIKEHQTGNPREILCVKTMESPMVRSLEGRLHSWFADRRVHGEWFEMNGRFIEDTLLPKAEEFVKTQIYAKSILEQRALLKNKASNGKSRTATKDEKELHHQCIQAKSRLEVADAKKEIERRKVLNLIGESNGVKGIVHLRVRENNLTFNKNSFKEAHPNIFERFITSGTSEPTGILKLNNTISLAKTNLELKTEIQNIKTPTFNADLLKLDQGERTIELQKAHHSYLSTLGEASEADFEFETLISKLSVAIGEFEAIDGVASWKRTSKETEKFDTSSFEKAYPGLYREYSDLGSVGLSVTPSIRPFRPYPIKELDNVELKTGKPKNAGKSWNRKDDQKLAADFDSGKSIEHLAESFERTEGSVAARLVRLGKIAERSDIYTRERRRGN